jgi:hypothetical protein
LRAPHGDGAHVGDGSVGAGEGDGTGSGGGFTVEVHATNAAIAAHQTFRLMRAYGAHAWVPMRCE